MLRRFVAFLCLALCAAAPVSAYTPESGIWWNPAEPGTGLVIEIQDNYIAIAAFVGDTNGGNPTWYTATGFLSGNARFEGRLDYFPGVQCIGCGWRPPAVNPGQGGTISIDFDVNDPTKGVLRWGGRAIQIERYAFYLKRPEDGSASENLTKMLGEWQFVLDFSTIAASNPSVVQYYGEVLVLDLYDLSTNPDTFEGCRPGTSLVGRCTTATVRDHSAVGYYDTNDREHVIVVDDSRDNFAVYVLDVGTNHAEGEFSIYRKGTNPSVYYAMRGFRSASRTFVQGGSGPSKAAAEPAENASGAGDMLAAAGVDVTKLKPTTERTTRMSQTKLLSIIKQLEAKLDGKATR